MHGTLAFPGFDIQDSFYENTISAKDKQGTWSAIASAIVEVKAHPTEQKEPPKN